LVRVSAGFNFVVGWRAQSRLLDICPDLRNCIPCQQLGGVSDFFYDINTRSSGTCCASSTITSGTFLDIDLTALYKFGKWELGLVAFIETQTTSGTGPGCPALMCGPASASRSGAVTL
jgi:hypothetical protein